MGGAGAGAHASLAMLKKKEDEDEDDDDLSKTGTLAKLSMLATVFDFGCFTHTLPPETNKMWAQACNMRARGRKQPHSP